MEIIIFLLLNSFNFANSYLLVKKYFIFDNIVDSICAFFILFFSQIILITTLLGSLNQLFLINIIVLEVLAFVLLLVLNKTGLGTLFRDLCNKSLNITKRISFNKPEHFFIAVILGFGVVKIITNLMNPPFGWDSLNYHFTFPVEWLKHGNLINPIVINDYPAPSYYPINGSVIYFWFILPFKSVFLADLGQMPFYLINFLLVFSISRKLGINRACSIMAAALFTLTPNYFKQLHIAYVDVMVAAWFLLAINFLFNFYKNRGYPSLVLSAMAMGLGIGTKTIVLPQAAILLLLCVIIIFMRYRESGFKKTILNLLILVIFIVILGGFTYFRNFVWTNNPFYPLDVKLSDLHILKGVLGKGFPGGENSFSWSEMLFHEGIGSGFILFVIPGIILAVVTFFRKKELRASIVFLIILLIGLYSIYRYIVALPNLRYLYPWLGICYILAFLGISNTKIPIRVIYTLAVVCVIATSFELSRRLDLVISLILSGVLYFIIQRIGRTLKKFINKPVGITLVCCVFIVFLQFLYIDYERNEFSRYGTSQKYTGFWRDAIEGWQWINSHTNGQNIAYIGRPAPFPLYGSGFKNNVYYVSVNKTQPVRLHDFPDSFYDWDSEYLSLHVGLEKDNNYRGKADYSLWLANIQKTKTNYLFVYSLHQTKAIQFPAEDFWAAEHPAIFDSVFKNGTIHIYKIR